MPAVCTYCNKTDNNPTLQCDSCKGSVHISCSQIEAEVATRITRQRAKGIKFFCNNCNKSTDQFAEIKLLLQNLSARIESLELRTIEQQRQLPPELFETIVREARDRIKRENNLIIYGIPEDPNVNDVDEATAVLKIAKSTENIILNPMNVSRLGAINPSQTRPRPMRVVLNNSFEVIAVLRNKNALKTEQKYKNVLLKNDETPYQRELLLKCKNNLKERTDNGELNLTIKYIKGIPSIIQKN